MTPVFGKGPHMGVIEPIGIRKKPESLHLHGARAQILYGLGPNGLGASGSALSSFVSFRCLPNPLTSLGSTARSFYRSLPGCKASFAKWQATSHRITATRRHPKLAGGRCPLGTPDKGAALCTPGTHSGYDRPQRSTGSFRRPSPSR